MLDDLIIFEQNAMSNFTYNESSYDLYFVLAFDLLKSFPESNFPWTLPTPNKNVLWIICTVSVKGIKSLFSLRSDIKLEISVQKTNKGCTSYLADSRSFLQQKSCKRYQLVIRETHFDSSCDSAKFDVHPLFVFCMPDFKFVIDS